MSYRVGFCPCCDCQIMVQNSRGVWDSYKPNFRQADFVFKNGQKARTIICEECLNNPNIERIFASYMAEDSEAFDEKTKVLVRSFGTPLKIELAVKARQGVRLPHSREASANTIQAQISRI